MAKYEVVNDIRPSEIDSAYVSGPFDLAKEALESEGYEVIGLKDNAKLRMQFGPEADVSIMGNWVKGDVLYLQDKRILLSSDGKLILDNAKYATDCHRRGEEFYLTNEQVESSLEDSIDLRGGPIPTNRFAEDYRTAQIFGEVAGDYGNWLGNLYIREISIRLGKTADRSFVKPVWFNNLDNRSYLNGNDDDLYFDDRVRGVKRAPRAHKK